MRDPILEAERALTVLMKGYPLTKADRRALMERMEEYLYERHYAIVSNYERIAQHVMKWNAFPSKRSNSWRRTVIRAQREIRAAIERGGVLAKYSQGECRIADHELKPDDVYRRGMSDAVHEFLADGKKMSQYDAEKIFRAANPRVLSLAEWRTVVLPTSELPPHETPIED